MNAIMQDARTAARQDHDSVIELTRDLVRLPSRGGVDRYDPIIDRVSEWLAQHDLQGTVLTDDTGAPVALTCEVQGSRPGPRWVLDACLDTAPFGDENAWRYPPTSAVITDGWLWGRGSADSKSGAAIFCHIAARLAAITDRWGGTLTLLFDVDEHTGRFGGATRCFEGPGAPDDVAGVIIGYPGLDTLVVGGRGVYRASLHVHGAASHSGASVATPNAIDKAAQLIRVLSSAQLPPVVGDEFPLPGKLTVTAISGGGSYSATPDLCTFDIDIRTTPVFDTHVAALFLEKVVAEVDDRWPGTRTTIIETGVAWPAYTLEAGSRLRTALLDAAHAAGIDIRAKIAGPTNIGNYLAGLGIAATAGFGVAYVGLHATDERIRLDTIPTVQAVYQAALMELLAA